MTGINESEELVSNYIRNAIMTMAQAKEQVIVDCINDLIKRDILVFYDKNTYTEYDQEKMCLTFKGHCLLRESDRIKKLCQRVEELEAENKRLHDKYDFQLLVKRDEQQQATIDKLVKALEKSIEFGEYAEWAIEADKNLQQLDIDARQCLAEVRGEK